MSEKLITDGLNLIAQRPKAETLRRPKNLGYDIEMIHLLGPALVIVISGKLGSMSGQTNNSLLFGFLTVTIISSPTWLNLFLSKL